MHNPSRRPRPAQSSVSSQVETLYRLHHRRLLGVARRLVPSDHEDLVSEAFVGLMGALSTGHGPDSSPGGYLARSVRHGAMRVWRDRAPEALALTTPAHTDGIEVTLVEAAVVRSAFGSLPERWQHVLWLTVVEDWPLAKVAAAFGLTPAAAAVLAHRARVGLRKAFAAAEETTNEPLNGKLL